MAKEEIQPVDLIDYEDSLHETAARLRKIRENMILDGTKSVMVNIGTLRHAIGEAEKYSAKLANECRLIASQNTLRDKLSARKNKKKSE